MTEASPNQRFTLRIDMEQVANMAYLIQQHPYRYQNMTDLIRQALAEYLAARIQTKGTQAISVNLPARTRARLQRMIEGGYADRDQLITAAVNQYCQALLEDEALFLERIDTVEEATPAPPRVPSGLMQE